MADNIIVASGPSGATYNMATDDGFGVSADAQVQIIKPVFGDTTTSTRVSNTNPMPVQLFSGYSGGSTASIIEDGELKVKGTFNIGNSMAVYGSTAAYLKVIVAGGVTGTSGATGVIGSAGNPAVYSAVEVTGAVQGISGGQALAVSATDLDIRNLTGGTIGYTGSTLSDYVAVQGISGGMAVSVSATDLDIRNLTATDVVTVVGTTASNVGVTGTVTAIATDLDIRDLAAGTDSVAVYNSAGGTTLPVDLYAAGTALGVSGDALKVAFDSVTGVTFSVNVASDIGVSNTAGTTLAVEGRAGMVPVTVQGEGAGDSVVVSATDLDIRDLTASDQVTVVGDLVTHGATTAAQITQANQKIGTLNNTVSGVGAKVDTANTSLTTLSDSVVTVGNDKLVKTSMDRVTPPSQIYVATVKVSGAGKPLASATLQNGVTIKSSSSNIGSIFVGATSLVNSTSNGFPLLPGEELFISILDPSKIFVRTDSRSSTIHVIGS
jgi:collagen type VII alpha